MNHTKIQLYLSQNITALKGVGINTKKIFKKKKKKKKNFFLKLLYERMKNNRPSGFGF